MLVSTGIFMEHLPPSKQTIARALKTYTFSSVIGLMLNLKFFLLKTNHITCSISLKKPNQYLISRKSPPKTFWWPLFFWIQNTFYTQIHRYLIRLQIHVMMMFESTWWESKIQVQHGNTYVNFIKPSATETLISSPQT